MEIKPTDPIVLYRWLAGTLPDGTRYYNSVGAHNLDQFLTDTECKFETLIPVTARELNTEVMSFLNENQLLKSMLDTCVEALKFYAGQGHDHGAKAKAAFEKLNSLQKP